MNVAVISEYVDDRQPLPIAPGSDRDERMWMIRWYAEIVDEAVAADGDDQKRHVRRLQRISSLMGGWTEADWEILEVITRDWTPPATDIVYRGGA